MARLSRLLGIGVGLGLAGCVPARGDPATPEVAPTEAQAPVLDVFDAWLDAPYPVSDGLSSPVGEGWDRCGPGCWQRARAGAVRAPTDAEVVEVSAGRLSLRAIAYENHHKRTLTVSLDGLESALTPGQRVRRGAPLGAADHLTLSFEDVVEVPEDFIAARPSLPVPQREPVLALIHQDSYTLRLLAGGEVIGTYAISLGQAEGAKERRGDNRTPKGVYYVTTRSQGPFDGPYGAFFGEHWIKLNYPNAYDAARGVDQGLITVAQQVEISRAWRARRQTLTNTALGGGIGLHGWAYEWPDDGPRHLSWGCVVLHLSDVSAVYERLVEGAMVVIF